MLVTWGTNRELFKSISLCYSFKFLMFVIRFNFLFLQRLLLNDHYSARHPDPENGGICCDCFQVSTLKFFISNKNLKTYEWFVLSSNCLNW